MIRCPECGSKISSKATKCPFCGFQSKNSERPISEQDQYREKPTVQYDIIGYNQNRGDLSIISYEDNKSIADYFGNWENVSRELPAIATVIQDLANKQHYMIAKMDGFVKKLIDDGVFRFSIDKNGEILPTIRDANGFVKQVRLEEMSFAPNVMQSLNNLTMHAALAQILDEIEYIGDAIHELHIELQNDRLAVADSAYDTFLQAKCILDSRIRTTMLLSAIKTATEAKRGLMRNFSQNLQYIKQHSNKNTFGMMKTKLGPINQKAIDSLQSLNRIANTVQIECEGYAALGEYKSARECINEFLLFVEENNLGNRDTLLLLNENATQKRIDIVDRFSNIKQRIIELDSIILRISQNSQRLLYGDSDKEDDENE